jgi:hypothetical protein
LIFSPPSGCRVRILRGGLFEHLQQLIWVKVQSDRKAMAIVALLFITIQKYYSMGINVEIRRKCPYLIAFVALFFNKAPVYYYFAGCIAE